MKTIYCVAISLSMTVLGATKFIAAGVFQNPSRGVHVRKFSVPGYPPLARQARVQGDVSATVHLDKAGRVVKLTDVKGPSLLQNSINALKGWQFEVTHQRDTQIKVTFRFSLVGPESVDNKQLNISGVLPELVEIVTNPTSEKPGPDTMSLTD